MRAARTDANHEAVVKALREAGATVQSLVSVGKGVPDLLVGFKSQTMLMEVKDSAKPASKRRLTEDQLRWHGSWRGGPLAIVDSPESALSMLRLL
jgi:Holliday junction resolvase